MHSNNLFSVCNTENDEMWSDSEYNSEIQATGLAGGFNVGSEGKRRFKNNFHVFGLNNHWLDDGTIY